MRLRFVVTALLAILAGCANPDTIRTASENGTASCESASPCDANAMTIAAATIIVTPTTPATGVAGGAQEASPSSEAAVEGGPTPEATPSPTSATRESAAPGPSANDTREPTPDSPPTNATSATPTPTPSPAPSNGTPVPATATPAPRPHATRRVPSVTLHKQPVASDGTTVAQSWGGWSARAGGRGGSATNYIAITNTGEVENATVTIQFNGSAFIGVTDPSWIIPIAGNVEFAAFEDATPEARSKPSQGAFQFATTGTNAFSHQMHGVGNTLYVAYRIVSFPDPLPAQAYNAPYVVVVS